MATIQTVQAVQYNQIPADSEILSFKPLGKNDSVTFRIKGSFDPSNPKKRILRTMLLPQTDVIKDPVTGAVYDIAYISGTGPGGVPILGEIWFNDKNGSALTLHGKKADHVRQYNYIMISNYLADNPNSDPNKHLIELESEEKDQSFVRNKRKKVQSALNAVDAMTDDEVLNFLRANRLPVPPTPGKRRFYLEGYAEKEPDKFAGAKMLDYTALYPLIDEAKKKSVISYDSASRSVLRYDDTKILEVSKKLGSSWKDELAKFLNEPNDKSKEHLNWIRAEVAK